MNPKPTRIDPLRQQITQEVMRGGPSKIGEGLDANEGMAYGERYSRLKKNKREVEGGG